MFAGGDFSAIGAFNYFIQGLPATIKEIKVLGFGVHDFLIDFRAAMVANIFVQNSEYLAFAEWTDFMVFFL